VTSCELFLLTESYSWQPKGLGLGLEVATRTCWEHVLNKVLPDLEGKLKLSKAQHVPNEALLDLEGKLKVSEATVPVTLWPRSGVN